MSKTISKLLQFEQRGAIGILTLNRPQAMNALCRELREAIEQRLSQCEADNSIRVLVITGTGKAFCAGNDLKELSDSNFGANVAEAGKTELAEKFAAFKGPIIAAVNGFCITAGFEMALACDLIIASDKAVFADTHARVGVLPGWGLSQRLPRLIGMARAKELAFTGNQISAEQACQWGFVNRVVEPDKLMSVSLQLAEDMCSCEPRALIEYKALIHRGMSMHFDDAIAYEAAEGIAASARTDAATINQRREQVIDRGREQKNQSS